MQRPIGVLVVPTPNGVIGSGTLRDLRLAEAAGQQLHVLGCDGRVAALAAAEP